MDLDLDGFKYNWNYMELDGSPQIRLPPESYRICCIPGVGVLADGRGRKNTCMCMRFLLSRLKAFSTAGSTVTMLIFYLHANDQQLEETPRPGDFLCSTCASSCYFDAGNKYSCGEYHLKGGTKAIKYVIICVNYKLMCDSLNSLIYVLASPF